MAERVVYNSVDLASAVADMDIDVIYFGADIELGAPIAIPTNKPSLTFDGSYQGVIHRFTDMNSNQAANTLGVNGASSIALTFQNMNMTGRNYYGIPYISESGTAGVTLTYRDISYVGPQLVFHPLGLTRFENVDITISASPASGPEEVGEVCRVEFSGANNVIQHNSTTDAVFWFRGAIGTAYFRLLPGAVLHIDTDNYFMYNNYLLILYPVTYDIQTGARFTLNANHGISHDSAHTVPAFTVGQGALFRYTQEAANGNYASLYLTGSFTVGENANVYMQANYTGAQPLLDFPSGAGASLVLNNPKSFVLYNSVGSPMATALFVTRSYSITARQLNHWTTARAFPGAGTFTDIPQNAWHNADWGAFTVSGNISQTATTATATGLVNPGTPITNFSYQSARVISAGDILIEPDPIVDNGRPITGLTEPNANLIISFTLEGTPYSFTLTAGEDGRFEVDTGMPLPMETVVSISANTPFLIKTATATVVSEGEIFIESAPVAIVFRPPPVATNPLLLRRIDPEASVDVRDRRPYPTRWELLASITGPLQTADGEVLENAVVFRDENNMLWDISGTPIVVYTSPPQEGLIQVSWLVDKGVLVRVTQPIHSGVEYSTQLIWTLNVLEEP